MARMRSSRKRSCLQNHGRDPDLLVLGQRMREARDRNQVSWISSLQRLVPSQATSFHL